MDAKQFNMLMALGERAVECFERLAKAEAIKAVSLARQANLTTHQQGVEALKEIIGGYRGEKVNESGR